jgi:hypothetical protein
LLQYYHDIDELARQIREQANNNEPTYGPSPYDGTFQEFIDKYDRAPPTETIELKDVLLKAKSGDLILFSREPESEPAGSAQSNFLGTLM